MGSHRFVSIEMSGPDELLVFEVHETSEDGADWLSGALKYADMDWPNVPQLVLEAFSKCSRCGIVNCQSRVEVGAHVTADGESMLIVPSCKTHNGVGNLDRLGRQARLKPCQVYARITFRPGFSLEAIQEDQQGKFYLVQNLPYSGFKKKGSADLFS